MIFLTGGLPLAVSPTSLTGKLVAVLGALLPEVHTVEHSDMDPGLDLPELADNPLEGLAGRIRSSFHRDHPCK